MFGLFKKKEPTVEVVDRIYMSEGAKLQACKELQTDNPSVKLVAWFEDTRKKFQQFLDQNGNIGVTVSLAQYTNIVAPNEAIIFVEHYPSIVEEQQKFAALGLTQAIVYSSLDEPLFEMFGGQKIIELMHKMGMQPHEMIQNKMVSGSIKAAQDKIAKKMLIAMNAQSQRDWLQNAGVIDNFS